MEVFLVILFLVYLGSLLYLAALHVVRGGSYRNERLTDRALLFSTAEGDFRFDRQHRKVNVKRRGQKEWRTYDFDDIANLYVFREVDTASIFEFFLGGFGWTDFLSQYRDVSNSYSIRLRLRGSGEEVILMTLKQYEQREWFWNQYIQSFNLEILRKAGLYRDIESVGDTKLEMFIEKFQRVALTPTVIH